MALLVLVVDRDDDVGVKAGIETPVTGRDNVLKAAEALLLADPEDSDGNTLFAAVKLYDELVSKGIDAEIALISGDPHLGLVADTRIRRQLEDLFSERDFEGIVFVSDGAEDDQVIPIVTAFAPIVSKRTVIVKQAQQLERTFYTLKTALEDPSFARLLLGLPGIILLLWFFFQEGALRIIAGILGFYLLLRGFGLEEPFLNTIRAFFTIDPKSPSLPFQIVSLAALLGGSFLAVHTYLSIPDPTISLYEALRLEGTTLLLAVLLFLLGKSVEAIYRKQSYRIGDYVLFGAMAFVIYLIGDALLNFLEGKGSALLAIVTGVLAVFVYYILANLALWMKRAPLISKSVVGATVYDRTGVKMGRVRRVEKDAVVIEKGRRRIRVPLVRVKIRENRLVVV